MKEVEFYSNTCDDIKTIAKGLLFGMEEQDPASIHYKRVLERPQINWYRGIAQIVIPSAIFLTAVRLLTKSKRQRFPLLFAYGGFGVYVLSNLKRLLVGAIRIYQHFAPDSIRMKCRFEPSCSQYMILALEKYGLVKGLKMGIRRLGRCRVGNGGYDFP